MCIFLYTSLSLTPLEFGNQRRGVYLLSSDMVLYAPSSQVSPKKGKRELITAFPAKVRTIILSCTPPSCPSTGSGRCRDPPYHVPPAPADESLSRLPAMGRRSAKSAVMTKHRLLACCTLCLTKMMPGQGLSCSCEAQSREHHTIQKSYLIKRAGLIGCRTSPLEMSAHAVCALLGGGPFPMLSISALDMQAWIVDASCVQDIHAHPKTYLAHF